ncbi:hypothetical protein [Salinimicrobium sp. HB62]|uniref:hypothetical protein n=1 Tax=Salinimicrobium sp. HB62 TaxID=3077781 RepID=UPI002D79F9A6|nr:hypothetical protein [Salinimicrobium sp. HB62]
MEINKVNSDSSLSFISKASSIVFILTLSLFTFFLFTNNFFDPHFAGDESKYLSDLTNANKYGLGKAILDGASITYLTISYYLNKLIQEPLYALKITSILSGTLMFLSLYFYNSKYLKIRGVLKKTLFLWIFYLFVIQTTFFAGVNDILLDLFGTLFLIVISLPVKQKNTFRNAILLGFLIALILGTRKMALTYILTFWVIFIAFSITIKNNRIFNAKIGLIILLSFIAFFTLLNFYPLLHQKKFSFDDKVLKGTVNWAQWDYHNALLIDRGVQERFQHTNIPETQKFILENGDNSLPSTFLEMIYFDPALTFKEFFIDLFTSLKYIFRQTGFLALLFLFILTSHVHRIFKTKTVLSSDFIYIFSATYLLLISFIVITNIQGRWFMFFLPMLILSVGKDLSQLKPQKQQLVIILNNVLLSIMCFPYLLNKLAFYF